MALNFKKLSTGPTANSLLQPKEIFNVLPQKDKRYQYLRDVQGQVLNQWYGRRGEACHVIKMNTGGGKTVVGLLVLKSCLNEGIGPAVYLTPTPYLAEQVIAEANALKIDVADDPSSSQFVRGRAILVTTIKRLINGKSVFGVGSEGIKLPIGSMVIDDAHACLTATEEQFSLRTKSSSVYDDVFAIFKDDLREQSETGLIDLEQKDPSKKMLVPFWAWQAKHADAYRAFDKAKNTDDAIKFSLPLLKDSFQLCRCVIGNDEIEVSSPCLPMKIIPAFGQAKRRVFMSATFSNEGVLVTHFDVAPTLISNPIFPDTASDIGERIILLPQTLDLLTDDAAIKGMAVDLAKKYNVVVIVPSAWRAEFWKNVAQVTLTANNLAEGVEKLRAGYVGLTVIINKYDGIDLPGDACRVLILDGLPDVRKGIEKIEQSMLLGSDEVLRRAVHRLEQGMGRGIRSNEDYCAVILMGRSLIGQISTPLARSMFSPATRAQLALSQEIAQQLEGKGIDGVKEAIQHCLDRDPEWVAASRSALVQMKYEPGAIIEKVGEARRDAFNSAIVGNYHGAVGHLEKVDASVANPVIKGWIQWQIAEYMNFVDPVRSQRTLAAAIEKNNQVPRPRSGVSYVKLKVLNDDQAATSLANLRSKYSDGGSAVAGVLGLLDLLDFAPDTSNEFEMALKEIGLILGFGSHRPEREYGKGPDNLWALGELKFCVIECKNEAVTKFISKHDSDQLSGSINWFKATYDTSCVAIPVIVHPSKIFDRPASPPHHAMVLTPKKLSDFKIAVRKYIDVIAINFSTVDTATARDLLNDLKLARNQILNFFFEQGQRAK